VLLEPLSSSVASLLAMHPPETFVIDLERAADGDEAARRRVYERSYEELQQLAKAALNRGWRGKVSMSTIDVLHDAFARLCGRAKVEQRGRAFFFGCFAKTCRDVLVDHWKKKSRRGEITLVTEALGGGTPVEFDPVQLDDLLQQLSEHDERGAIVATMRIFACMTHDEVATALGVSLRTVEGDWAHARLWLQRHYP
jgi:RNA polymerase sigma factor (TIGR02999 family)